MLLEPAYVLTVLLVFVRIGGLLVAAPFFRQPFLPVLLKVFLAVLLAYGLAGFVGGGLPPGVTKPLGFVVALGIEALTGLLLGFAAQFVFFAVSFAGDIMGFQMGLSMAQVFNPIEGDSSNPLGRLLSLFFLLLFVLLDGPHHLFRGLALSFEVVPLAGAHLAAGGPLLLEWTGGLFASALRLAAPFMVTLFLIDVALGVFARVVPQADLFSLGLPLKLFVGLALLMLFVQAFVPAATDLVGQAIDDLYRMVEVLAG